MITLVSVAFPIVSSSISLSKNISSNTLCAPFSIRARFVPLANNYKKFHSNGVLGVVKASAVDANAADEGSSSVKTEEKQLPPLESKMEEKMQQKLKMKLAKKIRLRRKRLLRKRHLRKKGRWPPSKMNKLKNV